MSSRIGSCVIALGLACAVALPANAQSPSSPSFNPDSLTIEAIMQAPSWMGHAPEGIRWSTDSRKLYFDWNPHATEGDSLYVWQKGQEQPLPVAPAERSQLPSASLTYSPDKKQALYTRAGDLYLLDLPKGESIRLTTTRAREARPRFDLTGNTVYFSREDNLFAIDLGAGTLTQLTDLRAGKGPGTEDTSDPQRQWVEQEEARLIEVLSKREAEKNRGEKDEAYPRPYYLGRQQVSGLNGSPDGRFITCRLALSPRGAARTQVPTYIAQSGYTENLTARPKVGAPQETYEFLIYDRAQDTLLLLDVQELDGIYDSPAFLSEYTSTSRSQAGTLTIQEPREVIVKGPQWSPDGKSALVEVRSADFKDRWLALLDPIKGSLIELERQHDEAWIGGPGINRWLWANSEMGWMPDNEHVWFISEQSGFAHLYTVNIRTGLKRALTSGAYEVSGVSLSAKGKYWYFTSNAVHPGEKHFYRLPVEGGEPEQLTTMPGNNQVTLSPDERTLAIRHSTANRPWELFVQANKPGAKATQITSSVSEAFQSYPWRVPAVVTIPTSDGKEVYARIYRPEQPQTNGPAVIFVHGAGYLQNAHKWWSSYYREYMFHNLLVDQGYTVLDIDYRGSAGYGRDCRTAIYRHMGGRDLQDHVDGLNYLVEQHQVDPKRVGIYGGSYGGFISLMALFTRPGVFAAGAALRPVTDWAHYNHAYTASILNRPQEDSLAYVRSSPIYHAEGLQDPLLICHGMVDTNVHFQDVVRLSQRLIELGKRDWSVAFYPVEGHGFREPSSWADEYTRIFELFETHVKGQPQAPRGK